MLARRRQCGRTSTSGRFPRNLGLEKDVRLRKAGTSFLMCCNAPKEGIAGECGYGCKPGWSRLQLGGALQRERKVTTAALKALRCSALVERNCRVWHNWSNGAAVGALPQAPQGAPPLDPARGNPPLTPPRDCVDFFFILLPRAALLALLRPFPHHFIRNCSFAAPHWQCVIAHAIASAASSGFGISFIPKSSFTIC